MRYRDEYKKLHEQQHFSGYSVLPLKTNIYQLVKHTNSKTLLDYGSGKGHQYSKSNLDHYWGVVVDCYDPGYEPFSVLPDKTYDGVVCTEVMEHIPEDEVDEALHNIFSRADKFVFMTISLKLASKKFANGDNVHVTIKTAEWWNNIIDKHNTKDVLVEVLFS